MTTESSQGAALQLAYAHCEAVAREQAKNFYYAFVTLPRPKRQAIYAAYAFCRLCDDIADGETTEREKAQHLQALARDLEQAEAGAPQGPVFAALAHAAGLFHIPWDACAEVLRGAQMDLERDRYQTFEELRTYCYRVASVVGLICVEVFGYSDPVAREHAVELGLAMQLTNILRDLREDADRGRIYLPQEELERFGYSERELLEGAVTPQFQDLMRFQVSRARDYFRTGKQLLPLLPPRSRSCPAILGGLYTRILSRIEARGYDVFAERVSLDPREKLLLAARLWLQSAVPLARVATAW